MRWIGLLLGVLALVSSALAKPPQGPVISIIIDDLGDRLNEGRRTVALPGPVACAFLPHTPHVQSLAEGCHQHGKEVMLHLPMQAMGANALGRGGVTLDMRRSEFGEAVRESLAGIPHVVGVNNHMGSLLTRHPGHMTWLMEEILEHREELFFVDSRTTASTVAEQMAREAGVPTLRRHVFLDNDPDPRAIDRQFDLLLRLARRDGRAVAIGHPYPSTLDVLERRLAGLQEEGVELISVRRMIGLGQ